MNEKIKLLAEQARAWVNNYDNVAPDAEYTVYRDSYDKKFAELIIRECAEVANDHNSEAEGITLGVGRVIKEHFGVEE